MNKRKKAWIPFVFPCLYLLIFFFLFIAYFPKLHDQRSIRLSNNLIYTGFDSYTNDEYVGSYYYQFTDSGLHFYLLDTRKEDGLTAPLHFQGKMLPESEELTTMKQTLALNSSFSQEDIDALMNTNTYFQQISLALPMKIAMGISVLLAVFSIYEIVHHILLIYQNKKCLIK